MTDQRSAAIPTYSQTHFHDGIKHPDLWLWDSWVCERDGVLNLYCLALNRQDAAGSAIRPADRNNFKFHVRRFTSSDGGQTWWDRGCFLAPADIGDGAFARNVWSGSAASLPDGRFLFAFTGVRELGPDRAFLQTLCVAAGETPDALATLPLTALSCPLRDYDAITATGYYLGPREALGNNDGEAGGPILAWRDPFIFVDDSGVVHLFWSAKVSPTIPTIAHATLRETRAGFVIDRLSAPLRLPDADKFTQAEVPKVYEDRARHRYFLLIAACDRLFEGQADEEVTKVQRLYVAPSPFGPWSPHAPACSLLAGLDQVFGASVLKAAFERNEMTLVAPYTEQALTHLQLTFAPRASVTIGPNSEHELASKLG